MNFLELAEKRYSCREFSDRPVAPELLDQIIRAAVLAPTAVNRQPFSVWVMESEEAKQAIHACTSCTFGAGTFLVVGAKPEDAWVRPFDGRNFADVDAAIVATHMMLEVEALGLGTTWVGFFDAPRLKTLYPQMADHDLVAMFPIGYPSGSEKSQPSARHALRRDPDQIVTVL